jgi:predicted metal-binding protein
MPVLPVLPQQIEYDPSVRGLCVKPYPLHPRGCPNFGKKPGCPPGASRLAEFFDLYMPTWIIYNRFDFAAHVEKMRAAHPNWSQRQLECCLYWQAGARKKLEEEISFLLVLLAFRPPTVERCPEAMGLNVTATLKNLAVEIEWPPKNFALQVAFAGYRK